MLGEVPRSIGPDLGNISRPGLAPKSDILLQRELSLREVLSHYSRVNAVVAVEARMAIDALYASGVSLNEPDRKSFADRLDRQATATMEQGLHSASFISEVIPDGCEGVKENRKALELGEGPADLPVLTGTYGAGHAVPFSERHVLSEADSKVKLTIDPVEGTTRASLNQEGAVAVIAGTLTGDIAPIPPEDSPALYADRVVASPRLKGKVSLDRSPDENIKAVMEEFGLTNPQDVEIVLMDRERNRVLIDGLQEAGATLRLIKSGDLMPAIEALIQNRPMLSMGSGGKQEAVIAACAAKALGGVFELRYVTKEGKPVEEFPDILRLDDVVSGPASDYFVNFASITGVSELGLAVPEARGSNYIVPVVTITSENPGLMTQGLIV
ncbi:MAG: fructose-bisphosphatase class II [Patescibacteria group bacterium]|nr:fructose-bisphosphatase class II [Patescibacteria group bacterium]